MSYVLPTVGDTTNTWGQLLNNWLDQNVPMGFQGLTGGGTITSTTIATAISNGFTGLYLDPRNVWTMAAVAITNVSNFEIRSEMGGSVGWQGNTVDPPGYIATGSGTDGIQIYAEPTGTVTQGVVFRGCAFVGTNTNAVVHYAGGQRSCKMIDCYVHNSNATAGAYAIVVDANGTVTGGTSYNSEDQMFTDCQFSGAYAAIGIDTGSSGQHANDTLWTNITTAGGTYSIYNQGGSNHTFLNFYDRSSPSIAVTYNSGGVISFIGGEDYNPTAASGLSHLIDAGGTTTLINRTITQGSSTNTVQISAGQLLVKGRARMAGTCALSGTGVLDLTDPSGSYTSFTISGTVGTLYLSPSYTIGSSGGPVVSGWSGTTVYVASLLPDTRVNTQFTATTSTQTWTWTPAAVGTGFRTEFWMHVTNAGTTATVTLTVNFMRPGGTSTTDTLILQASNSATLLTQWVTATGTGEFWALPFVGRTDASGSVITLTATLGGGTPATVTMWASIEQVG